MNKAFKIIVNSLLVLLIIVLVGYFALRISDRIKIYKVETGSMEKEIHRGDYILLFRKNQYKVGDVVTYVVDDYFVTHRIIKIEDDKVITKGDANNAEDNPVNADQIVGKVVYYGGLLNYVIKLKFAIVAVLIGLYLLSCYFDKEKK